MPGGEESICPCYGRTAAYHKYHGEKKEVESAKYPSYSRAFLFISIATIGFSLNGPFGRMVDLPSGVIAWGRGLFASIGLYILLRFRGEELFSFHDKKDPLKMVLLGLLLYPFSSSFSQNNLFSVESDSLKSI